MDSLESIKETLFERLPKSKWKEHRSYSSDEVVEITLSSGNNRIFLQYKYGYYMTRFILVGKDGRGKPVHGGDDFESLESAIDDLIDYIASRFPNKL